MNRIGARVKAALTPSLTSVVREALRDNPILGHIASLPVTALLRLGVLLEQKVRRELERLPCVTSYSADEAGCCSKHDRVGGLWRGRSVGERASIAPTRGGDGRGGAFK